MVSERVLNDQSNKSTIILNSNSALIVGIVGLLLPIGIQDFVVHRFFWGSMHIVSLLLCPVGFLLWAFDGYCAGGKVCTQPPGILSIIGSCILGWTLVLLILNLFECVRLISSHTIVFSKKSFTMTMVISTIVTMVAFFVYRLFIYYD